jgi:predicted metal-dependent HD superfamily phosphohydrolase
VTELVQRLAPRGLVLPVELLVELRASYATPGRTYHAWPHVEDVAARYAQVARDVGWRAPKEVFVAVLYHDAVYVPGAKTNEADSAALARSAVQRFAMETVLDAERIERLIHLTARHGSLTVADVDPDEALFLDCDVAILGADPAAFDAYDRGIAAEYGYLSAAEYAAGRRAFLARVLRAERIFLSRYFHDLLDASARANLARALA